MIKYTGHDILKWSGCFYDQSWLSVLNISRYMILFIIGAVNYMPGAFYDENSVIDKMVLMNYCILLTNSTLMVLPLVFNSKKNMLFFQIINEKFYQTTMHLTKRQIAVKESTNRFLKKFIHSVSFYYIFSMMVNFFRRPLFNIKKVELDFNTILPVLGFLPFEVNSWFRYVLVCIIQFLVAGNMVLAHVGMLFTFVIHSKLLCEQFQILTLYIEDTFEKDENIDNRRNIIEYQKFIEERMKFIIKQHISLLKYLELFQEIYDLFLLLFAITSGSMVCTVVYVITDPKSTPMTIIIVTVCLFLNEVLIIGVYCWFGQQITDKCAKIGEIIYEIPWYRQTLSIQKSILKMLAMSNRKKFIKGGGVQEFSLKGFSELLQASFSYFNMLKAMR